MKEDIARKTQLLQHMKVQLENANNTLLYLEPQIKDKDVTILKLQKQLNLKDKILIESKDKMQSITDSFADEENSKKSLNLKLKHLHAEISRKDLWLSQLKQQCHDLELNNKISEIRSSEHSVSKDEDHLQSLKATLNRFKVIFFYLVLN